MKVWNARARAVRAMQLCRSGVFPVGLIFHDNMDSGIALQANLPLRTVLFCRSQLMAQSADATSSAGAKRDGSALCQGCNYSRSISFALALPAATLPSARHQAQQCPTRKGLGRCRFSACLRALWRHSFWFTLRHGRNFGQFSGRPDLLQICWRRRCR